MILNVLVTDHVGSFWYKQPKLILCLLIFKWCLEITIAEEKDFPVKMAELVNLMDHAHVHYLTVDLIVLLTQVNHVIIKWKTKLSPCLKSSEIQNKNITLSEKFQNSIEKSYQEANSILLAHIHDRSFSWFETRTSIKSGGVKLVNKVSPLTYNRTNNGAI